MPDVAANVDTSLSLPNTYQASSEDSLYTVGLGYEFGVICQASEFFSVAWMIDANQGMCQRIDIIRIRDIKALLFLRGV